MRDAIHELRIRLVLAILFVADAAERWAGIELRRLVAIRSARKVAKIESKGV